MGRAASVTALLLLLAHITDKAVCAPEGDAVPVEALLAGEGLSAPAILQHHHHAGDLRAAAAAAVAGGEQEQQPPPRAAPVLAYVTPWNGRGYDLAKQHRCRLDYVSPVWYQLRSSAGVLTLTGGHDVDAGWLHALRQPCSADGTSTGSNVGGGDDSSDDSGDGSGDGSGGDGSGGDGSTSAGKGENDRTQVLRVVPRVIFELQGQEAQEAFERPATVAALLAKEAQRHAFDGWVFEGWSLWAAMGITQHPQLRPYALSLLRQVAQALAPSGRRLLLAVSPLLPAPGRPVQLTEADAEDLLGLVDGLSVMTYDFGSGRQPAPNAPLRWVEQNADAFAAVADRLPGKPRHKVLLGLPFYGYEYRLSRQGQLVGVEAVLAGRLLEVLRQQQQAPAAAAAAQAGGGSEEASEEEQQQRQQQCGGAEDEEGEGGAEEEGGGRGSCAAAGSDASRGRLRIRWLEGEREHVFEWSDAEAGPTGSRAGGSKRKKKKKAKRQSGGGGKAGAGERHLLYFPTPRSLAERLALARRRGMGASVWELGQGMDAMCALL